MATFEKNNGSRRYDSSADLFPPTKKTIKKIIIGVRVKEIIEQNDLIGFSYETLKCNRQYLIGQ
jgi:hypothetical protein